MTQIYWNAKYSVLSTALLWSLVATIPARAQAPPEATYDETSHVWTISNDLIRAAYRLDQGRLQLSYLRQLGGRVWVNAFRPSVSPIYLNLDGVALDDKTAWQLVETHVDSAGRGGIRHILELKTADQKTQIILRIEVYPGQPFLRTYYSYRNADTAPHYLKEARLFNLELNSEMRPIRAFSVNQVRQGTPLMFDPIEQNLSSDPTQPVSVYAGAYADQCTWLALRDDADNGLALGWEFDGRSQVNAMLSPGRRRILISGGPLNLNLPVAPGNEVTLPASFLGLFHGDWDEAGYRTQRFTEAVLAAPLPDDSFPYLMFDSWGYRENIDEATLRQAAQIAAQIGVETFIVDFGWAKQVGQWVDDPVKFPSGLAGLSAYVHSLGMKFGLHFVPSEASPDAPVLLNHPDWTASVSNDYYGADSLCLGNTPTRGWSRSAALGVITRYKVDWFAQDGENLVKECTKTTHTHDALNSNWANSVDGIDSFIKALRSRAPQVNWENNADGGSMSTFEAVKHYATFGSCDACEHLPRRQAIYGMSYVFPPRFISRYMEEGPIKFTTRSSMFGGPWILMQRLTELTPAQIALLRDEAAIYKSQRSLIRDGKVFHLLPRADGHSNEAIESFKPEWNRGIIFVYRTDAPSTSQIIFPRGLDPASNYRITFQESREVLTGTGAEIMSRGINVKLPNVLTAEIVYITGL